MGSSGLYPNPIDLSVHRSVSSRDSLTRSGTDWGNPSSEWFGFSVSNTRLILNGYEQITRPGDNYGLAEQDVRCTGNVINEIVHITNEC